MLNKLLWLIPIAGAVLGGFIALVTMASSASAPQEAAGYAMACAFAVIPYVFARAIHEMVDQPWQRDLRRIASSAEAVERSKETVSSYTKAP